MAKPGFFFFTGDWVKDTSCLSLEAQGAWIRSLCLLHEHDGQVTWPVFSFGNYWGVSVENALCILTQLELTQVANVEWLDSNKTVAKLINRRMVRAAEARRLKAEHIHKVRSEAGKKGMAVRYNKPNALLNPSLNLLNLNSESNKNYSLPGDVSDKRSRTAITSWPDDALWLKGFLETTARNLVATPNGTLLDHAWWNSVSETCGGLSLQFLTVEFNRMSAWLRENPSRSPATSRGWKRFVRRWLEKAHEHERRFGNAQPRRFVGARR